jgi:hypothetical protein
MIIERTIDQFVSGPEGMAGCYDLGRVLLSIDAPISSRRAVRVDIANQTVSGVGASQHRGRTRPRQYGQFVQHLRVSQGSLKELETHLILAERVGILPSQDLQAVLTQCESLGKMVRALIRSLQDKSPK